MSQKQTSPIAKSKLNQEKLSLRGQKKSISQSTQNLKFNSLSKDKFIDSRQRIDQFNYLISQSIQNHQKIGSRQSQQKYIVKQQKKQQYDLQSSASNIYDKLLMNKENQYISSLVNSISVNNISHKKETKQVMLSKLIESQSSPKNISNNNKSIYSDSSLKESYLQNRDFKYESNYTSTQTEHDLSQLQSIYQKVKGKLSLQMEEKKKWEKEKTELKGKIESMQAEITMLRKQIAENSHEANNQIIQDQSFG